MSDHASDAVPTSSAMSETAGKADEPAIAYSDYAARSAVTRQQLLDAAVAVLVEHGYSGASTLKIQQRAGVSRGRLLHQFPHRDTLLVAAVQHLAEARFRAYARADDMPEDPIERVQAAIRAMWLMYHQDYFWASTELWLAARQNEALAAALRPKEHQLGRAIRDAIEAMFGRELFEHPRFSRLRGLLNSSMRGVALTYSFEPRDPLTEPYLETWTDLALRELGLSAPGGGR